MDVDGPVTERCIKIKKHIEHVGRAMGIPEAQAFSLVQLDAEIQLAQSLREANDRFDWRRFFQKSFAYIAGILKSED